MPHAETRTELVVTAGETAKRLDQYLANREPFFSRSALQRFILGGHITVNGQVVKPSHKVRPGERITIRVPRPEPLEIQPEPIPLEVLFEDDDLLVINKPAGLVVHPAPGHWTGTLVNALLYHIKQTAGSLSAIGGKERPGLVHRLDKDTTGVLVVAKQDLPHRSLANQFKRHTIRRVYEAVVWGKMKHAEGTIEASIGRDVKDRKKFSLHTRRPKESTTVYKVVERFGKIATRVELYPGTGRTHQLRVHLASLGNAILGDPTYGGRRVTQLEDRKIARVMLHARTLGFIHPTTQKEMIFHAPIPQDMEELCGYLRALTA